MSAHADPVATSHAPTALAAALAEVGVHGRVEARGALAIVVAADAGPLADPAARRRVAALAATHGFTHVALELDPRSDRP